jgi:hypothetical protein
MSDKAEHIVLVMAMLVEAMLPDVSFGIILLAALHFLLFSK